MLAAKNVIGVTYEDLTHTRIAESWQRLCGDQEILGVTPRQPLLSDTAARGGGAEGGQEKRKFLQKYASFFKNACPKGT